MSDGMAVIFWFLMGWALAVAGAVIWLWVSEYLLQRRLRKRREGGYEQYLR